MDGRAFSSASDCSAACDATPDQLMSVLRSLHESRGRHFVGPNSCVCTLGSDSRVRFARIGRTFHFVDQYIRPWSSRTTLRSQPSIDLAGRVNKPAFYVGTAVFEITKWHESVAKQEKQQQRTVLVDSTTPVNLYISLSASNRCRCQCSAWPSDTRT